MKFLRLAPNGHDIDQASYRVYEEHLDSIEHDLPPALYRMLRFPREAYEAGRTFYDSVLTEWQDVLDVQNRKHQANLRILSPGYDREIQFTLHDPDTFLRSQEGPVFRVGELYCLELSKSPGDSTFSFCFLYITRVEVRVDCTSFSFEEHQLSAHI